MWDGMISTGTTYAISTMELVLTRLTNSWSWMVVDGDILYGCALYCTDVPLQA
jgi:hypothetical protein